MIETEQYLQVGDIELRAKDIKTLLEEHNNMKQDIKRLKEEYMILQNASDKVEEEKDREIERLKEENTILKQTMSNNSLLINENALLKSIIKEVREYINSIGWNTTIPNIQDNVWKILDKVGSENSERIITR